MFCCYYYFADAAAIFAVTVDTYFAGVSTKFFAVVGDANF